jgi:hypothetical protein
MATPITTTYATIGSLMLGGVEESGVEWILQDVQGWGAPGGSLAVAQKPRQSGAWGGDSFAQARPMVFSGTTLAPSAELALDALDRLIEAFSLDASVLTVVESSRSRWVSVRRDGEIVPTWLDDTEFSWSVQVVSLDSRKFGAALTGSTLLPATSGGVAVPFTVPFIIDSTVVSGQVALTNPGNTVGPVTIRIDGPAVGPVITHTGFKGTSLVFASSLVLNAGEWLTINMETRTAMANDQASRSGYITTRGWFGFDPGVNVFAFTASGFNSASLMTVTVLPSWQ